MASGGQPPGWFDDPTGRHDHRYWDGARWTENVADQGVTGVDPASRRPAASASPIAGGTAVDPVLIRAERQAAQRRADPPAQRRPNPPANAQPAGPPRKKRWPWVLGGIFALFIFIGGSCAVLLGVAVNNAVNTLNAEQRAHAITSAQFDSIPLGSTQAQVVTALGKQPESSTEFVSKGVVSTIDDKCIYYNKAGGKFGPRFQFCFANGSTLTSKNAY